MRIKFPKWCCFGRLFEAEEQDLFHDLETLPRNAALRKLNDLIKRARLAKVHAYIISSLRKDMPSMFGKDSKKKELIKNLEQIYLQIQREHQISQGDFPDVKKMQVGLLKYRDMIGLKIVMLILSFNCVCSKSWPITTLPSFRR